MFSSQGPEPDHPPYTGDYVQKDQTLRVLLRELQKTEKQIFEMEER